MHTAKQTLALLRRRPILWLPQLLVAVTNLLLNTASTQLANHLVYLIRAGKVSFLAERFTLRTPDALNPAEAATIPILYSSRFVQYLLILTALAAVAILIRDRPAGLRHGLRTRAQALLNTALLITGLYLLDITSDVLLAAAFSYVPALRPAPAWLLIVLQWTAFTAIVIAFYWIAVPWVLRLAAPTLSTRLSARQKNAARWIAVLARGAWDLFDFAWGRVEGHFIPPRVDPGPFWHAPITLGGPVFLFVLLTAVSVAAAVIAQPHARNV